MEIPPQTRYAAGSGGSLAYQEFGDGPPLVMIAPIPSHLDLMWINTDYAQMLGRLGTFARVLLFDTRGVGMSDPVDHVPTLEEQADDVEAVLDAAGVDSAFVFAMLSSTPSAVVFAARAPGRARGLILYEPYAQGPDAVEDHSEIVGWDERSERMFKLYGEIVAEHWGEGRTLTLASPGLASERLQRAWGLLERSAASPTSIRAVLQASTRVDLRATLAMVQAPSIVLRKADGLPSEGMVRQVAELIPDAELRKLPASSEVDSLAAVLRPVADQPERLVTGGSSARGAQRRLATVLFSDIVESTELAARIGDESWRGVLIRHGELLRRHVAEAGGRVVDTAGDGAFSLFDGPARAIRCAEALREEVKELGVRIRAGLHAGECEFLGDGVAGIAVHIGARVCAAAGADEVLVSRTVRDLVVGSGLRFEARGARELKGVPGEWELFSLAPDSTGRVPVAADQSKTRLTDRMVLAIARRRPQLLQAAGRLYTDS